jgi:hypothetical protein
MTTLDMVLYGFIIVVVVVGIIGIIREIMK